MTVCLWGYQQQQFTVKGAYLYAKTYLEGWFPHLPSYQAFCKRMNLLAPAFERLASLCIDRGPFLESTWAAIDSMPIIVAKSQRSGRAKVVPEFCAKTYCASRREWYYGIKLHVLASLRHATLPFPRIVFASPANLHDIKAAKQLFRSVAIRNCTVFADKAYQDSAWEQELLRDCGVTLKQPSQRNRTIVEWTHSSNAYHTWLSSVRQPIESLFSWLNTKTAIQHASKVRSAAGLISFVFSRLAFAVLSIVNR